MKNYLLFMALLLSNACFAQETDTLQIKTIHRLEQQMDSLQNIIKMMNDDLQQLNQNLIEGQTNINELMAIFDEGVVESASFDSRSKRKRVDALLKAITQQPGQLRFNGSTTSILQGAKNTDDWRYYATGSFDIFAHTSFGKGSLFFINMEAIGGDGPDQHFNTLSGINGDAGNTQSSDSVDRLTVLEAWGEFTMFKESVTITAGKIDLTNYFDNNASANDETMQFLSGSFINSSAFTVPSNSPGVRFRTTLANRYHIQFAMASIDNAGADIFDDLYKIASLGWTFAPGSDFESNIRIYGYQHPHTDNSYGWGVSFNKVLFGSYNIFGRYGQNESEFSEIWGIKSSWSAGTRFVETIAQQTLAIGIAYGENTPIQAEVENERLFEIYVRRQINNWVHLSPIFQYYWNINGTGQEIALAGIRTHFNF